MTVPQIATRTATARTAAEIRVDLVAAYNTIARSARAKTENGPAIKFLDRFGAEIGLRAEEVGLRQLQREISERTGAEVYSDLRLFVDAIGTVHEWTHRRTMLREQWAARRMAGQDVTITEERGRAAAQVVADTIDLIDATWARIAARM